METPFWENSYKDDNAPVFGTQPNAALKEFLHLFNRRGFVLDVGCGDGKNSLYLSELGYANVEAFDLSESAIARLNRLAADKNLQITSWVQDLKEFEFGKNYDLIMSFGTLHFVEKEHWKKFLLNAQKNTNENGIHIIQIFTNALPASPDIAPFAMGTADDGELKSLYGGWDILQFKSYTFEDEHPGVPKHYHASKKIVARKAGNAIQP